MNNTSVFIALAFFLFSGIASYSQNIQVCESKINRKKSVMVEGTFSTSLSADGSRRWLEEPVLKTSFKAKKGCVLVDLSGIGSPQDGHIVFQLQLNGVPMLGHATSYLGFGDPGISDADQTDSIGPPRIISFSFFAEIPKKGRYTLELFWSGCCSGEEEKSGAVLINPKVIVQFRK